MIVAKASSLPYNRSLLERCFPRVGSGLTQKHFSILETVSAKCDNFETLTIILKQLLEMHWDLKYIELNLV
jgi:hypothetical protein